VAAVEALAGGPYGVLVESSLVLSGSGYSPSGLTVSYAWDLDGDGEYDDATGASPVFSAAGLLPQTLDIGLCVTDTSGASGVDRTMLRVLETVYVDDSATGLGDGTSWADAYTSLQPALTTAAAGQVIRVGQGTYRPTAVADRTASFRLGSGISIYGGYAGYGAADPDARDVSLYASVLSGEIGTAGDTSDNSYHVVVGSGIDSTAVLDGFTITGGNANGSSTNGYGGGMYNSSCSLTLANCRFTANSASSYGGGICNSSSFPTLINCTFTANSAGSSGGGMYNASSSPTLTSSTFTANSANEGGGMYNYSSSSPTLANCTFTANWGGNGGGMSNYYSSSPVLTNCILWGNTGSLFSTGTSDPVVTYCDVQFGYPGSGNINADPRFIRDPSPGGDGTWRTADDDYGDLRLQANSPCIDAGRNAALPSGITTDLAGNPRFADVPTVPDTGSGTPPIVDMGAYERLGPTVVGRHIFYNNCKWDAHTGFANGDPAANEFDDSAIATDKVALLPGGTGTLVNYTSYLKGINGIMIDIAGLPGSVTEADFQFLVGNSSNLGTWTPAPAPASVTVRPGAGDGGSDRVTVIWADSVIRNKWLQVTMLAANTGLAANDVHYWGNQVGETGNNPANTRVDAGDASAVRAHYSGLGQVVVTSLYDINRDQRVDAGDFSAIRASYTGLGASLVYLSAPPPAPAALASGRGLGEESARPVASDKARAGRLAAERRALAAAAAAAVREAVRAAALRESLRGRPLPRAGHLEENLLDLLAEIQGRRR